MDLRFRALSPLLVLAVLLGVASHASASEEVVIDYFWGDGCGYCAVQRVFLDELVAEHPDVVVRDYEVWYDQVNLELFAEFALARGIEPRAVPTTFLGDRVWVGFDETVEAEIRQIVEALLAGEEEPDPATGIELPILGPTAEGEVSLVVATLLIGLVDGFNPCSLWAISILLALLVRTGSRTRVAVIGGTFLLVTALVYGGFIAGLYTGLGAVTHLGWVRTLVASLALILGVLSITEYLRQGRGFSLSIPETAKPSLYRRMRSVVFDRKALPAVVAATVGLAAGVAILELPCTAGLPVLWSDLVSASDVATGTAAGLLGLYIGVYLLDELALVVAAIVVMRSAKLQDRHGLALKLVSGWVMVALAAGLLFAPGVMQTLVGVLVVFLVALGLAAATWLGTKLLR